MKKLSILALAFVTGCSTMGSNYVPVVDMRGHAPYQFQDDLSQCQQYAKQRADAAQGAAAGALAGAIIGGIFAAILTPRGYRNEAVAPVIAAGALGGAYSANETQQDIVKRCLVGRGYNVLN